jgi:hypothetical protein
LCEGQIFSTNHIQRAKINRKWCWSKSIHFMGSVYNTILPLTPSKSLFLAFTVSALVIYYILGIVLQFEKNHKRSWWMFIEQIIRYIHFILTNVRILFSSIHRSFVDYALVATYYGANCVYIVFIGASIKDVINYEFGIDWDVRIYIAMSLIPVLMVGQVSQIKWFFLSWIFTTRLNEISSLIPTWQSTK